MDRLATKQTPEGTLTYTYDAAGHVASIASSNANGASMSYSYDILNRLSTVVDNRLPAGQNTTAYAYDDSSNVTTVTYPNGVQALMHYDPLNRVTALATQTTGYSYQRDAVGNLQNVLELSNRQVNWTYDGIYRLTGETITSAPSGKNGAVTYGLDPVGNRDSVVSSLGGVSSGTWTYNPDDEVASETYDPNGNVTAAGGKTFSYDSQNELVSMNGGAVQIVYDADGNRVAETVAGVTTRYLVDDLNPTGYSQVVDEMANGVVQRTYTYGLQRISEDQVISGTWTPSFYGYDGQGNVANLTNSAGAVTDTNEYDGFGNIVSMTGTTPNEFLYRGEQYDGDLGLYYLRARWYNPLTGSFMSRDPEDGVSTNPKTLHKYLYAGGDPIDKKDPTGRDSVGVAVLDSRVSASPLVIAGEVAEAAAVACVFNKTADLLGGLAKPGTLVSITQTLCSVRVKKCRPCNPPVNAGDLGYRLDDDQKGPHFDKKSRKWITGVHWHLFYCNQRPPEAGCTCNWEPVRTVGKQGVSAEGELPYGFDIETNSCSGGGVY